MINLQHLRGDACDIRVYNEHRRYYASTVGLVDDPESDSQGVGTAPNAWHGRGADCLGLAGEVEGDQLEALLHGDGFGRQRHARPRLGTDLSVSAPKSVSIAALTLGDTRLLQEHDAAVRALLDYVESTCVTTRSGRGGRIRHWTGNLVAGVYRHEDGRPVEGIADPDLHSHAIVANLTRRRDGAWRTVDLDFGQGSKRLFCADAVYLSRLAHGARYRCGYVIEQRRHGFDIGGIDESIREAFSRRRKSVDDRLAIWGTSRRASTSRQRTAANHATRAGKTRLTQAEQRAEWRTRADMLDLELRDLPAADGVRDGPWDEALAAARVADALERMEDPDETDIIRSMLDGQYGRLQYEDALRVAREKAPVVKHAVARPGSDNKKTPELKSSFGVRP